MSKKALLIIDVQNCLIEGAYQEKEVLGRIADLQAKARHSDVPVIFVQHNEDHPSMRQGAETWQIHPAIAPLPHEIVIQKTASDSFYKTNLQEVLQGLQVEELVVTGMQSEYCVDTTCRRALSMGYDVLLVADAHTTVDDTMEAAQIVAYHNHVLYQMSHPDHAVTVKPTSEVSFT